MSGSTKPKIFELIHPNELPRRRREAEQAGLCLDAWPTFDGADDLVSTRLLTRAEFEIVQTQRYLGLLPDTPYR